MPELTTISTRVAATDYESGLYFGGDLTKFYSDLYTRRLYAIGYYKSFRLLHYA